jgi:hypothetical protein
VDLDAVIEAALFSMKLGQIQKYQESRDLSAVIQTTTTFSIKVGEIQEHYDFHIAVVDIIP